MTLDDLVPAGAPATSADSEAVTRLVLCERQTRDLGWYEQMADCFTADAAISMSWFTGSAAEFIATTRSRTANGVWRAPAPRPWCVSTVTAHGRNCPSASSLPSTSTGRPRIWCRTEANAPGTDGRSRPSPPSTNATRSPQHLRPDTPHRSGGAHAPSTFIPKPRLALRAAGTPLPDDLLGDDHPGQVAVQNHKTLLWLHG